MPHYTSHSPEATEAIGKAFAAELTGGERVGLCGPLGAGKTRLMQGVAQALPLVYPEAIASPSFAILNVYPLTTGGTLHHLDMYRLATWQSFLEIDGKALLTTLDPNSFVFIEWADRYPDMRPYLDYLIRIEEKTSSDSSRVIHIARAT